jgi:hypothetical protein
MTAKGYLFALSLTGSAVAGACWLSTTQENAVEATGRGKAKEIRIPAKALASRPEPGEGSRSVGARPLKEQVNPLSTLSVPSPEEELSHRAARVEQEANHDLRRLVKLLDLTEEQQDKVFQTLAEHSPAWTPALQVASTSGASLAGKRAAEDYSPLPQAGTTPGYYSKTPKTADTSPVPASTPADTATGSDMMSEIMALLDPGQQDALLKEEMDRAAWWAEILPQITPPDDIPALDGSTPPAPGDSKAYEGSDVLE